MTENELYESVMTIDVDAFLEQTKDSNAPDDLLKRFFLLQAMEKYDDALDVFYQNRKILEKNSLKATIIVYFQCLVAKHDFATAMDEINYYRELPYESQEIEELVASLPKFVNDEIKRSISNDSVSDAEIRDLLTSNSADDIGRAMNIIRAKDIPLEQFYPQFEDILVNFPNQMVRATLLMYLSFKDVEEEFDYRSLDEVIRVIPKKIDFPVKDEVLEEAVKKIIDLCDKDVTLQENATMVLQNYLICVYPTDVDITDDLLLEGIIYVAREFLQQNNYPNAIVEAKAKEIKEVLTHN